MRWPRNTHRREVITLEKIQLPIGGAMHFKYGH